METNKNTNDWVRKAFEEAEPTIAGKPASKVADEVAKAFHKQFVDMMMTHLAVVGPEKAAKAVLLIATDENVRSLIQCAFTAGYCQAIKAQEEKQNGEGE